MSHYRDPLLRAAFDLQSRLYNIVEQSFLTDYYSSEDAEARHYACENTLYVIAEYLGWVEILRREVRFLDLGDELSNRKWVLHLDAIRHTLLTDDYDDPTLRLFNGQQRAIGEIMAEPAASSAQGGEGRLQCIGYAAFVARQSKPEFARWFAQLRIDVGVLASEPEGHLDRLVALQHQLVELIDFLDPEHTRLPPYDREKLVRVESSSPAPPGAAGPPGQAPSARTPRRGTGGGGPAQ
jgi:hypothetical protein